jgi:LmbE family N-acetylglucosaminyl deacetylase
LKQIKTDTEPIYALAFGAHPDDVELACAATMLKLHREKKSVAICDLTQGEKGTRGTTSNSPDSEAKEAAKLLGIAERVNLNLGDTTFENNIENREKMISVIRYFKPTVVFLPHSPKSDTPTTRAPRR